MKPTLDNLGLHDKPHCIFNVDESGFPLSGWPSHILTKRGMKSPQAIIGGSGRENINLMANCTNSENGWMTIPAYTDHNLKPSSQYHARSLRCIALSVACVYACARLRMNYAFLTQDWENYLAYVLVTSDQSDCMVIGYTC